MTITIDTSLNALGSVCVLTFCIIPYVYALQLVRIVVYFSLPLRDLTFPPTVRGDVQSLYHPQVARSYAVGGTSCCGRTIRGSKP
jgi:hypothetical protein